MGQLNAEANGFAAFDRGSLVRRQGLFDWVNGTLAQRAMISPLDPSLVMITDDADEAVDVALSAAAAQAWRHHRLHRCARHGLTPCQRRPDQPGGPQSEGRDDARPARPHRRRRTVRRGARVVFHRLEQHAHLRAALHRGIHRRKLAFTVQAFDELGCFDERTGANQRLEAIDSADGIQACQSVRACSRECPVGIDVGEEIWQLIAKVTTVVASVPSAIR